MSFATFAQSLQKGKISEILQDELDRNDDPVKARVLPLNADGVVTLPLVIVWWLRGEMGKLEVDTEVWYAVAEDGSGIIFSRADGEWDGWVPGDVTIEKGDVRMTEGDLTMDKGSATLTDGNMTMTKGDFSQNGNQTVTGDLTRTGNQTITGDQSLTGNETVTGNVSSTGNISASGNMESQGSMTATGSLSAASVTTSGDVTSGSTTLNTLNTEFSTFKGEYAAHTHTTPAGQSGPPEG